MKKPLYMVRAKDASREDLFLSKNKTGFHGVWDIIECLEEITIINKVKVIFNPRGSSMVLEYNGVNFLMTFSKFYSGIKNNNFIVVTENDSSWLIGNFKVTILKQYSNYLIPC